MTDLPPSTRNPASRKAFGIDTGLNYPSRSISMRRDDAGALSVGITPTPALKDGEVLIRVKAAGVNPVDLKARTNGIPYSTGVDGAGEIVAVGSSVQGFKVGERVMWHASLLAIRNGRPECGAFNQYAVAPGRALVKVPDSMDDQTAAALPCPGGTAHQVAQHIWEHLRDVTRAGNEALFVQSASGAVGRLVVQILREKLPNIVIIGSASPGKHDDLRSLGVEPVPYRDPNGANQDNFELCEVLKIINDKGLKLVGVVDFQGGASPDRHYEALDRSGVLVCVLKKPAPAVIRPDGPVVRNIALGMAYDIENGSVQADTVPAYTNAEDPVAVMRDAYQAVVDLVANGRVTPPQTTLIPPAALSKLSLNDLAGKLIVDIPSIAAEITYPDPDGITFLVDEALREVRTRLEEDAARLTDTLSEAVDRETNLIAMNLDSDGTALNSNNSALDAARTTRGLCDFALHLIKTDRIKAEELFRIACVNWQATRNKLRTHDRNPIHHLSFTENNTGDKEAHAQIGEQGNLMRVNAGALYPVSDSVGLIDLATRIGEHQLAAKFRDELTRDMNWLLKTFYQPDIGTFTYHRDALTGSPADSDERGNYGQGVAGNDGTVYALSALLVPALKAWPNGQDLQLDGPSGKKGLSELVREQMDAICKRFVFKNGSMWETYRITEAGELDPLAFDWQMQPVDPPISVEGHSILRNSHVGIGGHTVMAAGQIAAGALELSRRNFISSDECSQYLSRAVEILNDAIEAKVVDWSDGTVSNGTLIEVPVDMTQRRLPWGNAAWQQYELVRTLLSLRGSGLIDHVKGPDGESGEMLLMKALNSIRTDFRLPQEYKGGFGDEWRYHLPQVVRALGEAIA